MKNLSNRTDEDLIGELYWYDSYTQEVVSTGDILKMRALTKELRKRGYTVEENDDQGNLSVYKEVTEKTEAIEA